MSVRVKICGITNPGDAEQAARLGANAIGLNFYPRSPRHIDEATAKQVLAIVPPFVEAVGLFVEEPAERIAMIAQRLALHTVQVHGNDPGILLPGLRWIPAFSVRDTASLMEITNALEGMTTAPAAILVDAHVPGMFGGTGQVAPWHLLADFHPGVPIILAGGLTPDNVAEAIRIVRPSAVDVASGVESSPGRKDFDKMRRFMDAVRRGS